MGTTNSKPKTLVAIVGATATGKTAVTIALARHYASEIISCDSRQFYREMQIGTAAPTREELAASPHHFIGTRSITEDYSCGAYEAEALQRIEELFTRHDTLFLVGGSGLYVDAVCEGMDDMPSIDPEIRQALNEQLATEGLDALVGELQRVDPIYYEQVDRHNPQRVVRALEVFRQTGSPYSKMRKGRKSPRPFRVIKLGIRIPRETLYERINLRVDRMVAEGLEEEARGLYPQRELNALQTVGYREWFDYFDGTTTREEAIDLIKRNSRRYAKRQETWFSRDPHTHWVEGGAGCAEHSLRLLESLL